MILNIENGHKHSGKFLIDGRELDGELTISGGQSKLYVHDKNFFRPDANPEHFIHGRLHDLTCISLLDTLAARITGSSGSTQGRFSFAEIVPHFILYGSRHLLPGDKVIKEITFCISDANAIFYDFDAFSSAIRPTKEQIGGLARAMSKAVKRKIPIGSRPEIAYFTGKLQIFRVKTAIGTIFTSHNPVAEVGSSAGVAIKNQICTGIRFEKPVAFHTAIEATIPVLQFMQILSGRKQELSNITLTLNSKEYSKRHMGVYWCRPPRRPNFARFDTSPSVIDLPIDPVGDSKIFRLVLRNWLERNPAWQAARSRFAEGFAKERWFDTDRLIGAANMFDLLPESAVPETTDLPSNVGHACANAKKMFEELPASPERDSVLSALGRLKKPNLKRKIRHRAEPVVVALGAALPNLMDVLELAVDARNHFVHGTTTKVDFSGRLSADLPFLTNALEFVFALSDLHESGWPVTMLARGGTVQSHPFGTFLVSYRSALEHLIEGLPRSHRIVAAQS